MKLILITAALLALIGLVIGIMLVFAGSRFAVEVDEREVAVRACLPGNNCGGCGYAGCDAAAAAIASGEAHAGICPVGGKPVAEKISAIVGGDASMEEQKVAFVKCAGTCGKAKTRGNLVGIDSCNAAAALGVSGKLCAQGCFGYGSCVEACQFDAIHIVDGIAKVDRKKCVACGRCAAACPQHLIELIPMRSAYTVQCSNREKFIVLKTQCDAGCRGCGLCAKQCEHGAIKVENNIAHIDYSLCTGCGKCAEKCPAKIIIKQTYTGAAV